MARDVRRSSADSELNTPSPIDMNGGKFTFPSPLSTAETCFAEDNSNDSFTSNCIENSPMSNTRPHLKRPLSYDGKSYSQLVDELLTCFTDELIDKIGPSVPLENAFSDGLSNGAADGGVSYDKCCPPMELAEQAPSSNAPQHEAGLSSYSEGTYVVRDVMWGSSPAQYHVQSQMGILYQNSPKKLKSHIPAALSAKLTCAAQQYQPHDILHRPLQVLHKLPSKLQEPLEQTPARHPISEDLLKTFSLPELRDVLLSQPALLSNTQQQPSTQVQQNASPNNQQHLSSYNQHNVCSQMQPGIYSKTEQNQCSLKQCYQQERSKVKTEETTSKVKTEETFSHPGILKVAPNPLQPPTVRTKVVRAVKKGVRGNHTGALTNRLRQSQIAPPHAPPTDPRVPGSSNITFSWPSTSAAPGGLIRVVGTTAAAAVTNGNLSLSVGGDADGSLNTGTPLIANTALRNDVSLFNTKIDLATFPHVDSALSGASCLDTRVPSVSVVSHDLAAPSTCTALSSGVPAGVPDLEDDWTDEDDGASGSSINSSHMKSSASRCSSNSSVSTWSTHSSRRTVAATPEEQERIDAFKYRKNRDSNNESSRRYRKKKKEEKQKKENEMQHVVEVNKHLKTSLLRLERKCKTMYGILIYFNIQSANLSDDELKLLEKKPGL